MSLHCPATLLLVPPDCLIDSRESTGAVTVDRVDAAADVLAALQALADLHRGERVVVPVTGGQLAQVLEHLGRAPGAGRDVVRLEVGDEGWALPPAGG